MSGAFRAIDPASTQERDPDRLYRLDRAACGSSSDAVQPHQSSSPRSSTATSAWPNTTCLRLHRAGLLERTAIVDEPGRAEYAYRVGTSGHQRLGTRRTPAPATYVRHMLDTVDAARALNRSSDREHPPVQLCVADSMTGDVLGRFVRPDSIVVVTTEAGSAVLAVEIDEATEHSRTSAPSSRPIVAPSGSAQTGI